MNNKLLKLFGLAFSMVLFSAPYAVSAEQRKIYLVRHAEKMISANHDPSLTAVGFQRARNLAVLLKDEEISTIYSTDYKRTKQTAAPTAKAMKMDVVIYDPRQLKAFAEQVKQSSGNLLIVGHSNTTPKLVSLLGGDDHGKIDESEYDRLYLLSFNDNQVTTKLLTTHSNKP